VEVVARLKEESDIPDEEVAGNRGVDHAARAPRLARRDCGKGPLRSHGSVSMNRALMAAVLVDRLQLTIFPVITGQTGAHPVFRDAADFDLKLIGSRAFDDGIQELIYRPARSS
jgi:dihydrofolate reductase